MAHIKVLNVISRIADKTRFRFEYTATVSYVVGPFGRGVAQNNPVGGAIQHPVTSGARVLGVRHVRIVGRVTSRSGRNL